MSTPSASRPAPEDPDHERVGQAEATAPEVSVIVIVRNGEAHIAGQLEALGGQVGAPAFEVIVADNGSIDGTASVVTAWIDSRPAAPVDARLVDASAVPGIPFARNAGARAAVGRIFAFCDSDDVVAPDWVRSMADGVGASGMAGGSTRAVATDGSERPDISTTALPVTHHLPYAPGCNFAVHRSCFFAVGGFDESLPSYGFDDVDFSWRVQKQGFPLHFVAQSTVKFTVTGNTASVRKVFLLGKARMVMIKRHPEFDVIHYSLGGCARELVASLGLLPWRMIRPRTRRSREIRWTVSAAGRLAGYWHYHVLGRGGSPRLSGPDPTGTKPTISDQPKDDHGHHPGSA